MTYGATMREEPSESPTGAAVLSGPDAENVRRRVQLLVDITSQVGVYRTGLKIAGKRLTRAEATIIADLEVHGLDVAQLREVLWGGHVLVDDPALYDRWHFPKSHPRISSHHKDVDKSKYPDVGLRGPLVREKLHGRTATGTWVQLEKTPAAMGDGFHLPTVNDIRHLCDYVVYRLTKSNVGPWGLSKQTERRPVYLSPALSSSVQVPPLAVPELTGALQQVERSDDTTSASPDLALRFPPPDRRDTFAELVFHRESRNGPGLFGASDVSADSVPPGAARGLVEQLRVTSPTWSLPKARHTVSATARSGDREVRYAVCRVPSDEQQEDV